MPDRSITIAVSDRCHDQLARLAKERGLSVNKYATILFDAAYAARVTPGGTGDADLDVAVARSVILFAGGWDTDRIAKAVHLHEATVVRIFDAWRREVGAIAA